MNASEKPHKLQKDSNIRIGVIRGWLDL